jgi:hypothetical protein
MVLPNFSLELSKKNPPEALRLSDGLLNLTKDIRKNRHEDS